LPSGALAAGDYMVIVNDPGGTPVTQRITVPISVVGGGTGASTAANARTNLGLVAGGAGDIWVEKAGDTMTGGLVLGNVGNALSLTRTGSTASVTLSQTASAFVPGTMFNLDYKSASFSASDVMFDVDFDASATISGGTVFDIDIGRCMFCGLCVEACPYDALFMGSGFEEAQYKRDDVVISVDRLRKAPKRPSTWFRPQLEAKKYNPHATHDQKKLGVVTKPGLKDNRYDPQTGKELSWEDVGRVEGPSSERIQGKWVKR